MANGLLKQTEGHGEWPAKSEWAPWEIICERKLRTMANDLRHQIEHHGQWYVANKLSTMANDLLKQIEHRGQWLANTDCAPGPIIC